MTVTDLLSKHEMTVLNKMTDFHRDRRTVSGFVYNQATSKNMQSDAGYEPSSGAVRDKLTSRLRNDDVVTKRAAI